MVHYNLGLVPTQCNCSRNRNHRIIESQNILSWKDHRVQPPAPRSTTPHSYPMPELRCCSSYILPSRIFTTYAALLWTLIVLCPSYIVNRKDKVMGSQVDWAWLKLCKRRNESLIQKRKNVYFPPVTTKDCYGDSMQKLHKGQLKLTSNLYCK